MTEQKTTKGKVWKALIILAILLAILVFLTNLYIVRPNEFAIIKQFGKIVRVVDGEGLHATIPFIETVTKLPSNKQFYDVPSTEVNTLDKKRIMVDYYTIWQIKDPIRMLETLKTMQGAETRLSDIMYSAVRNQLGRLEYGEIINPKDNNRGDIDVIVQEIINKNLESNNNGIHIVDVQIKRIDLPQSNEESVYKRMISERASKAQEYLSQGEAEKTRIMADVDRQVKELIAKSKSDAKRIVAEGEKEAQRIYNQSYGKDPEFFKMFTTLNSYRQSIDNETVMLIPISSPYLNYMRGE